MKTVPATPSFRLEGRKALVTGAGRGIGFACGAALAEAGAAVTLVARSGDEIEEAAASLRNEGLDATATALDVTDIAATRTFIEKGPCHDILVNNAGTNRPGPFLEASEENYDIVMDLNVKAAFFVAQAVARRLVAEGRPGSIINMSSQMGLVGGSTRTIYCASKHAIEGLTKAMALDLAPSGIRVNSICPTFIETELTRPYFENEAFMQSVLAKIKLGRVGQVEDLMGAVVFLASGASALMTSTPLIVDGGWTAE
jgi:NAD(P)-dependent dehydrogenase (short-subunit alcohol dehydrogenase family)